MTYGEDIKFIGTINSFETWEQSAVSILTLLQTTCLTDAFKKYARQLTTVFLRMGVINWMKRKWNEYIAI